jgi:hypothetical protein
LVVWTVKSPVEAMIAFSDGHGVNPRDIPRKHWEPSLAEAKGWPRFTVRLKLKEQCSDDFGDSG